MKEALLGTDVVRAIGVHRVRLFVLVGHCEADFGNPDFGKRRRVRREPLQMSLRHVPALVAVCVFGTERETEFAEPLVIVKAFADPNRGGMIVVCLFVRVLREHISRRRNPVGSIEKLGSFEDHLYDMLVAMIFRGGLGIE